MSATNPPVTQDDDGPEEGEIEDDEDDIILLDGSSPHRSSTTSTSLDVYPLPTRKDSYERDIRHFELRRSRISRRRTSGASKSTHSMGSSLRSKTKTTRTGLTEGKENRHVHRHTSPARVHRHRKESSENALADFKAVSPLSRDSSCSSIDSDERSGDRAAYYRSTRKTYSKTVRGKRKSSSSPESSYIPSKRRSHHLEKCPLMKVLHTVAKETRLIAMENSESHSESSSLRQRLLNMGAMSSIHEEPDLKEKNESSLTEDAIVSLEKTTKIEDPSKQVQNGSTQTEESVSRVNQAIPEVVILTDSEDVDSNDHNLVKENIICVDNTGDPSACTSDVSLPLPSNPSKTNSAISSDNEDDDDISHLRLLALQSKKHEPSPLEDADVLQLRLAALKTAFIKKLKIRKKISIKINTKSSKEDPLSPLDEIPMPFSAPSPDEVMTPVDMELAETDDEDVSVDSIVHYSPTDPIPDCYSPSDPIPDNFSSPKPYPECYSPSDPIPDNFYSPNPDPKCYSPSDPMPDHFSSPNPDRECYSPSDPTGSPLLESSLQDLLPPPPPPDLDLTYTDHSLDTPFENNEYGAGNIFDSGYDKSHNVLSLPPLPSYFRQLLSEPPEQSVDAFNAERESVVGVDNSLGITPIEMRPNLIEIPVVSDVEAECGDTVPPVEHAPGTKENNLENKDEEQPKHVALSPLQLCISSTPNVSEKTKTDDVEINTPNNISLEEEEKMLRQRLLLNMAKKRESLPQKKKAELDSVRGKCQGLPKIVPSENVQMKVQPSKKVNMKTGTSKVLVSVSTESSTVRRSTTPVIPVPTPSIEKRLIVNLGEDSDSCEDYSEAEALGQKCTENKEKWLLHLKELEVNPPKMISPGNKLIPVIRGKAPSRITIKAKQPIKEMGGKKPFAENLADLESSVERFLKGVRSSQEAISKSKPLRGLKSGLSNSTPVAVKHLPASQQEEYRRLKQQLATLEKQRQLTIGQKRGPQSVSKGTQITAQTNQKNAKSIDKGLNKAVLPSNNNSKKLVAPLALKNDLKVVPASGNSLKQPVPSSSQTEVSNVKAAEAPQTPVNIVKATPPVISSESVKRTIPEKPLPSVNNRVSRDITVLKGKTALANVSNLSVSNVPNLSKTVLETQKPIKAVESGAQSLSGLEGNLIVERSHVLSELSALAKLLSQVDQSLEAQSQTAAEVSSLIDKLCLAAGRWRAQNSTVTHLVQKVAQRQKELSSRHRRCVALSKSCTRLGLEQIGKNYRSPGDKADAMHLQLKQVHEKTQDLARRKTAERSRRNVLEKRAEECLMKLFSDINSESLKSIHPAPVQMSKAATQETTRLTTETVQIAPVSPTTSSTSDVPPPGKSTSKASYLRQVNSAMISKAMSLRVALNKVRYAKATLNLANQHSGERKSRIKYKKKCLNTQALSVDVRQDLSDMDISTDGEEVDRRTKHSSGNTEVVDMLVSPGSSLGPPETDPMNASAEGSNQNLGQTTRCNKDMVCFESFYDDILVDVNGSSTKSNAASVVTKTTVDKKQEDGTKKPLTSSRSILKDYISPLNGLNVFSSSSNKEKLKEGDLDPYAILCPYDLNGKCEDTDCQYKHQHR